MTYEDLQDTMMKIVDRTEIDIKNLIEQYNKKARNGQIKTIDGELEDAHEIDDDDLVFAIASLQAKLETILESQIMPKGMHMVIGLSSLNTRKRKLKITKQRMLELVEEHRLYNKKMKQSNNSDMMMSFDEYLDWCFGKKKLPKSSKSNFTPMSSMTITTTNKYPSHVSDKVDKYACSKMNDEYKHKVSSNYVIGQAYNKSGLQVLTKKETQDSSTGKRR